MSRLLFLVAVAVAVYWLITSFRGRSSQNGNGNNAVEDMVRCAHCGIHLPKSEGFSGDGKYFCSEAHHRAFIDGIVRK